MKKACKAHLYKNSKENVNPHSDFLESQSELKSGTGKLDEISGVVQQRRLLSLNEISRRSLIPLTIIEKICDNTYGNLTKTEAVILENVTGVCREAWIFPDRHFNPYLTDFLSIVRKCLNTCEADPFRTKE